MAARTARCTVPSGFPHQGAVPARFLWLHGSCTGAARELHGSCTGAARELHGSSPLVSLTLAPRAGSCEGCAPIAPLCRTTAHSLRWRYPGNPRAIAAHIAPRTIGDANYQSDNVIRCALCERSPRSAQATGAKMPPKRKTAAQGGGASAKDSGSESATGAAAVAGSAATPARAPVGRA